MRHGGIPALGLALRGAVPTLIVDPGGEREAFPGAVLGTTVDEDVPFRRVATKAHIAQLTLSNQMNRTRNAVGSSSSVRCPVKLTREGAAFSEHSVRIPSDQDRSVGFVADLRKMGQCDATAITTKRRAAFE